MQEYAVAAVLFGQQHRHILGARGGHVLADEIGADRQFPVTAVDQDRELNRARAAQVTQCVEGGADGAPGEEHIVDQDDERVLDTALGHRGAFQRAMRFAAQIVAVERDVE